jgi:DNA-directed RNA polymerase subunit E'/Rpb7
MRKSKNTKGKTMRSGTVKMEKLGKEKISNIYIKSLISQKVVLDFKDVNSEIFQNLEFNLKKNNEGKCIDEGYIKNNSVKLLTYSSGELFSDKIVFETTFECLVANPVESMVIDCIANSITKVGIRAFVESDNATSPLIIFIARDHHYNNEMFSKVKENDVLTVRIIGQRYELNDKFISVIAELININNYKTIKKELSTEELDEIEDVESQDNTNM